jgi:steroid 5-alpha reductase family enzyme
MHIGQIVGIALAAALAYMTLIWLASLLRRDASIVDIFWGLGFVLLNLLYYLIGPGYSGRQVFLLIIVTIWGLRLSTHILLRNWGRGEDKRYQNWRQEDPEQFWWKSYFRVFILQGILMWIISMPLLIAQYRANPAQLTGLDILGLLLWCMGFSFEAIADWQLTRFKTNPDNRGKVLRTGLWAYTRHPNYFGEATLWWGYFLIALATPWGFLTLFSPILMTFLLLRVSGVTLLERDLKDTKPQYADYIESTSAFFPWFPRRR